MRLLQRQDRRAIANKRMSESTIQLTDDESRQYLFLRAHSWESWASRAQTLRKSALVLWTVFRKEEERLQLLGDAAVGQSFDLEHEETALMLMGMSLEAMAKSCLVIKDSSLIEKDKIAPKLLTHDLLKLFKHVGIALDKLEADFLNVLTDFITWQGRYPAPTEAVKVGGVFRRRYEWHVFDNLYVRLYQSVSDQQRTEADKIFWAKMDEYWDSVHKAHSTT